MTDTNTRSGKVQSIEVQYRTATAVLTEEAMKVLDGLPVAVAMDMATVVNIPTEEPEVFEVVAGRLRASAVRRAVLQLPRAERDVLLMRYGLACPPQEWLAVCQALGCSDKTARRAERRGLERLRETVGNELS